MASKTLLITGFLILQSLIFAQEPHLILPQAEERCGTTPMHEWRKQHIPNLGTDAQFEEWISRKIQETDFENRQGTIVTIPIVVHVIHNGEPLGTYPNISDAQVLSQVNVLNQDFRRMVGTNGYNNHPDGADVEFEFCLAVIDPQGNSTNGINRQNLGENSWAMSDADAFMKPNTIWNPEQYFNIWVCNLNSILGYSQFPSNSGLEGLPGDVGASTDGIVIGAEYFGTIEEDNGSFILDNVYDLGRTATHEIGHSFGLKHIWGDGGCGATDYCDDTPDAESLNNGCPTGEVSCGTLDMIENYMDYTYDFCMNIFTNDQKARMVTVLENSPRRASLVNSIVCNPPASFVFSGQVVDAVTGYGIENAKVKFEGVFSPEATTNNNGVFSFSNLYEGTYDVLVGSWGHTTKIVSDQYFDSSTGYYVIELNPGYYDDFTLDFGWEVNNTAVSGEWVREIPIGSAYDGFQYDPATDLNIDIGQECFLTGNSGGVAGVDDVDNGTTTLISPVFDGTVFEDAQMSFYRWFAIGGGQGAIPDDDLVFTISNGSETVTLKTIHGNDANLHEWVFEEFLLSEYITVTNTMRMSVSISDQVSSTEGHLVDAAIDLFRVAEVGSVAVDETLAETIGFALSPNPTSGILNIEMNDLKPNTQIRIFDAIGRQISTLEVSQENTIVDLSGQASGIYFLQVNVEGRTFVRKVIVE